jgi:glucose/arabinose dehydrogenase
MSPSSLKWAAAAAVATAVAVPIAAVAQSGDQGPPPPPTAAGGQTVTTVAQGVPIPIAFAFGGGKVFVGAGGSEDGKTPGGIFLLGHGQAARVPGTKGFTAGVVWHKGKLYASSNKNLVAWSKWNKQAKKFDKKEIIFKGAKSFDGFSGLAFGPNGRLYAGIQLQAPKYDHKKSPEPISQEVVSMNADGTDLRSVATGLRQPWQLTFVKGRKYPFGSMLAQDETKVIPPDFIYVAKPGSNYGFPTCTFRRPKSEACKGVTKPFRLLPKHTSPQGITHIGKKLYVAFFGGLPKQGPEIVTMGSRRKTSKPKPFLTGYAAPVVAVGAHAGRIYTGDLTGAIYRVTP